MVPHRNLWRYNLKDEICLRTGLVGSVSFLDRFRPCSLPGVTAKTVYNTWQGVTSRESLLVEVFVYTTFQTCGHGERYLNKNKVSNVYLQ